VDPRDSITGSLVNTQGQGPAFPASPPLVAFDIDFTPSQTSAPVQNLSDFHVSILKDQHTITLAMGIIRTAFKLTFLGATSGIAGVGAGAAWLAAGTSVVPLSNDHPWFSTKTYRKYNPKGNPALMDDCIKRVPLKNIQPGLRKNEDALTLEFCRGIWGRWGM
jgi:hypothetical protein